MKILNNLKRYSIIKAYIEGIYSDTPQNRKLGRVGMSYTDYANKLKEKEEENSEKKYYYFKVGDEEVNIEEDKVSKNKIIQEAIDYAEKYVLNNQRNISFDIEENTDSWSIEDYDNKDFELLSVDAELYGKDKVEISIFDHNTREYIRNDKRKREDKNFKAKLKRDSEKRKKEDEIKYGWIQDLIDFKEKNKGNLLKFYNEKILNDDNQIELTYTNDKGDKVGTINIFKEPEEKTLYLENINVNEKYRRSGLGREILKKALNICKEEKDFKKIELLVDNDKNSSEIEESKKRENNKYLVDFYKSEGFKFASKEDEKELNPTMVLYLKKI